MCASTPDRTIGHCASFFVPTAVLASPFLVQTCFFFTSRRKSRLRVPVSTPSCWMRRPSISWMQARSTCSSWWHGPTNSEECPSSVLTGRAPSEICLSCPVSTMSFRREICSWVCTMPWSRLESGEFSSFPPPPSFSLWDALIVLTGY